MLSVYLSRHNEAGIFVSVAYPSCIYHNRIWWIFFSIPSRSGICYIGVKQQQLLIYDNKIGSGVESEKMRFNARNSLCVYGSKIGCKIKYELEEKKRCC